MVPGMVLIENQMVPGMVLIEDSHGTRNGSNRVLKWYQRTGTRNGFERGLKIKWYQECS